MNNLHDDGFGADLAFEMPDAIEGAGHGAAPLNWWRSHDAKRLGTLLSRRQDRAALTAQVDRVRPMAIEVARVLDGGDGSALIGALLGGARRRGVVKDTIADDLLASALLLEALCGDATCRLVVDHLRKQRGLPAISWGASRVTEQRASSAPCPGSPPEQKVTPSPAPILKP